MSLNNLVKRLQDIMRNDAGINGDAQRIEQMVWILFLKVYDAKEEIWEFYDENYTSIIPEELRWRNWAVDHKDGKALTGDALLDFVNGKLFPTLKAIEIDENTPMSQIIVRTAFEDNNNYMKDGILLRQVINVIDEIDFEEYEDRHAFGEIYETILRSLQSAGNSGEFYTPRAVTDFMVQMIKPKLGESIADFACGTGGFLTSALKVLDAQVQSVEDRTVYSNSIYGIEKKALPFLLCATNMLLHDIDNPRIIHGNSLEKNVREYKESDRFDVILMNPPYGGNEKEGVKQNFPADLRSSETADLFMSVIMYRLKQNGRCAILLPDGFLFGTDNAKIQSRSGGRSGGRKSSRVRAQSPQNDADDGGAGRRAAHFPAHGAEAGAKIRLSRVQHRQQDSHQPGRASALAGWSAADCRHLNFFAKCTCPVL